MMYDGFPLEFGIYHINIKYTPKTLYPCLAIKDGKLIFGNFMNINTYVTHEELQKAHQQGYKIFIIDACICL